MRCPTCGAETAAGAKFCEMCGTPLQQAVPSAGDAQPATVQPVSDAQPPSAQPVNDIYGQQSYEAPRSHEPAVGGPATGWEGAPQTAPAAQAVPPKQGSSAPFVLAIIALVTAVIGLFPISLVLAIIALVLNREQKKRGEQSSKQTPTLVMALIGLILSILMALATVVLGGAVWLALINDDRDVVHTTTDTTSQQAVPTVDPVGVWEVVSLTDGEDAYDEEYLKFMEDMGITFELVIAQDGTASLEYFGESEEGTWEGRGSSTVAITFDGDTAEGTIAGDELTISHEDGSMTLRRSSKTAPATVGDSDAGADEANSSSSASAASSASSATASSAAPSESASASSQAASSYDTDNEPTLGDFTWYAGAGGKPAGATELTGFRDVKGGWKAYVFGNGMNRLCNAEIDGKAASATITIDWHYVHNDATDTGRDDETPDETFTGEWDDAVGLEALGAGRLALTDFWQQGDHQYGMGSLMWPSGETDTVLLVRP